MTSTATSANDSSSKVLPAPKRSSSHEQKDDGDRPKKRRRVRADRGPQKANTKSKKKTAKMRRQYDEEDEEDSDAGDVEDSEDEAENSGEEAETNKDTRKHIRPCICDLGLKRRAKIRQFMKQKQNQKVKFEQRVKEIEEELERLEEERTARERELQEQQELFGDEYEVIGKKKKRKKRSARRASMVSLGVKQVINWRKPPKNPVKQNDVSNLRKEFTTYCGLSDCPESPLQTIDFRKEPSVPVRATHTFDIRSEVNRKFKKFLIDSEDKRPRFVTPYYV